MKARLTVEKGDYNTQLTVGNNGFVFECYLGDISTVPAVVDLNFVNTESGNITPETVFKGFTGFAKGQAVVGTFEQTNPNIIDTSSGDITPADVVLGKTGFAQGQEITGTLDVATLIQSAYNDGVDDVVESQAEANITPNDVKLGKIGFAANDTKIVGTLDLNKWQKDVLWHDVYGIIAEDTTPGYVGMLGVLVDDTWIAHPFKGADAYRTSDGAFYEAPNRAQTIDHVWQPNAYKTDSRGYNTKYVILYFKTPALPAITWWCYPVSVVAKNLQIPFRNFLSASYALQAYEHINCTYTGTDATNFLGGASGTQDFLQSVPDDIDYSNVTNFANALNSRRLQYVNLSTLDTKKLPANFTNTFLPNAFSLDTLVGVLDLTNNNNATVCANWQFIRKIEVRGITRNTRLFSQSTMPYEAMKGILNNISAPVVLSMLSALKTLTLEDIAELTQRGITITN